MRLLGVVLAGCVLVASVLAPRPAAASTADLVQQIEGLVRSFPGDSGLWIGDPVSPSPLYTRNADTEVIAASLYKLGILAEAERRVDAGQLHYNDAVVIQDEDITEDGSFEDAGTELTLDEALEAMITISDNGTALALWHILGGANIDQTLAKAGMPDFHIALDDSEDHTATPRALGTFLTLLARHQLVSPAASDRMLARLGRQKINNRLPAQLPENVLVAHKTGNLAGLVHDRQPARGGLAAAAAPAGAPAQPAGDGAGEHHRPATAGRLPRDHRPDRCERERARRRGRRDRRVHAPGARALSRRRAGADAAGPAHRRGVAPHRPVVRARGRGKHVPRCDAELARPRPSQQPHGAAGEQRARHDPADRERHVLRAVRRAVAARHVPHELRAAREQPRGERDRRGDRHHLRPAHVRR